MTTQSRREYEIQIERVEVIGGTVIARNKREAVQLARDGEWEQEFGWDGCPSQPGRIVSVERFDG